MGGRSLGRERRMERGPRAVIAGLVTATLIGGCGGDSGSPGTAIVDGLPGQLEPWSGPVTCSEDKYGPVVWIDVPAEVNEHAVAFDVFVATPGHEDPGMIIGGRPVDDFAELSGDAAQGRMTGTVDSLTRCRAARPGESPGPDDPAGYVCPYRDSTAVVTVTWECPR